MHWSGKYCESQRKCLVEKLTAAEACWHHVLQLSEAQQSVWTCCCVSFIYTSSQAFDCCISVHSHVVYRIPFCCKGPDEAARWVHGICTLFRPDPVHID